MNAWYDSPARILIIDDDYDLLNLVAFTFHSAGYETESVTSGAAALQAMQRQSFSLLVLDINMPGLNGLEVCGIVRRTSNTPILMLSARDEEQDMLQALDAGADAYLVKPFSPRTLIARSQALLRRVDPSDKPDNPADRFKLDINEMVLRHPDGEVRLTKLEVRVMRLLMQRADEIVSAGDLTSEVWNAYRGASRNVLKQLIFRLRRKLAVRPDLQHALRSANGGYMWSERAASVQPDSVTAS